LEVEYKGAYVPLNFLPIDAERNDPDLVELVNQFYDVQIAINTALEFFGNYDKKDVCETPPLDSSSFKDNVKVLFELEDKLKKSVSVFKTYIGEGRLRFKTESDTKILDQANIYLQGATQNSKEFMTDLLSVDSLIKTFEGKGSMTSKVLLAFRELDKYKELDIDKIKRYVLFFAQIRDSDSAEQVSEILKAYTMPSVSFFEKRRKHVVNIQSYVGLYGGNVDSPDEQNEGENYGIFAPIGLEFSKPLGGDAISLLLAPFDFGYPISLKLDGTTKDIEFNEIVAPSITLNYGFKDYPLAIGGGYQRGRSLENDNSNEERLFIHLSFDMPLFSLF
jgi:hypothetical protein